MASSFVRYLIGVVTLLVDLREGPRPAVVDREIRRHLLRHFLQPLVPQRGHLPDLGNFLRVVLVAERIVATAVDMHAVQDW